ncbi:KipI family sensor histidine kinase inhibitor [Nocardia tenerifensis]|uniref:KipI family sensor histidine kinase inhibitor n=1 Tax=Nocardia tenerifensis TaxID=228006 RepID=A0A318JX17_9NOCA|nr:allophanate hydrolase subunit 1 [Nocardia tenerifensis]PXX60940.1 KipI family sensor histidine kinase inhibitor [Nocardia tenerifensis]
MSAITVPAPPLRILPAGDRSVLVAPDEHADLVAFIDLLRREVPSGVDDVLPAAQTVLVTMAETADRRAVEDALRQLFRRTRGAGPAEPEPDAVRVVPVRYDGPDLEAVAAQLGMSVRAVIAAHTGAVWRCSFLGFAPGFGYLEASDSGLAVPRRAQSRTSVPAGSVALADGYSAVYPRRSPGGWQLIGTTDVQMWDLGRAEPSLLRPGTLVRFTEEASE